MSNVHPDKLRKWAARSAQGWLVASLDDHETELLHMRRYTQMPLTQDDLERVATLAMLAPGTSVEGVGQVWRNGRVFFLPYKTGVSSNE